ncbi:PREDICTED: galanin receptor type 1-like [Gekko japonicus]|uniref:Galanin receptor type 1-like n=1 Tax=Gekko japonicus TaxID=146911 RepID=A0ABM1K1K1_GEKJA|nr:PREDICTED: galanin receptor type 1-like [Gekko japonicus]
MELPEIREVFLHASNSTIINTSSHRIEYSFGGLTVLHLRHIFASFCGLTLLIGFAGNLFMLLVLIEGFQSSSSSSISMMVNTLMVNITISDLIFLLYNVSVLLFTFVYENWNMGAAVCTSSQSFSMWTMFCSFYSMVATSILRYVAVVHPTYSFSTNRLQRFLLCMLMWFMGFTVSVPNWMHQGVIVIEDVRYCMLLLTPKQTYLYFVLFGGIAFFPFMLLLVLCYGRIVQSLWCRKMLVLHSSVSIHLNKKATIMILTVLAVFILMWIPCSVVIYLSASHSLPQTSAAFVASSVSTVLAYSNCSVSPLICFSLSDQFQAGLKKLLCRRSSR